MADLKDLDVIRVCRSDGADTGPGYWPVTAPVAPAAKKIAAEKAPRAKPQMTRLDENDPRFVEWRVKLGILLKQELSLNPEEGNAWYVPFPRGYWLYEKSKHLWVSGYPIKAKLFKSPQEFALHLLWLLSASKDYRDCCCVHCNVPSLPRPILVSDDGTMTPSGSPAKIEKLLPAKVTPVPLPPMPGQLVAKAASPSQPAQRKPQPSPSPAPAPVASPAPVTTVQTQSPRPAAVPAQSTQTQPQQQQQQQQPPPSTGWTLTTRSMFRIGELVWYQNGNTWRLGVIAASQNANYELLPLGHSMVRQQNIVKTNSDMRPFHAFSVPGVTIPELKDKTFDQVPWEATFQVTSNDPSKRDVLLLDASKLAASKIDCAYSLWSPMNEDPSGRTSAYYGCFFGAERVEIGDCMRIKSVPMDLKVSPDNLFLGLRTIFTSVDYHGAVFFRGHVYQLIKDSTVAHVNAVPDKALPIAIQEEMAWRKQFKNTASWQWVLIKENVVFQEQSLRGRFYPTHRLLPILNPGAFQQALQTGRVDEQLAQLNNRMDGPGPYLGRKTNRLDAVGQSVAAGSRLSPEPHVREEMDGLPPRHGQQQQQQQ